MSPIGADVLPTQSQESQVRSLDLLIRFQGAWNCCSEARTNHLPSTIENYFKPISMGPKVMQMCPRAIKNY